MQSVPPTPNALDPNQLRRIEATHRGFLYQHLYGVACLLMCVEWGWSRMLVEVDEDIELEYPDRRVYVQVKTRASVIKPADVSSVFDRFESYRQEHAAQRRPGRANFVLALNSEPSPTLAMRLTAGQLPDDVRVTRPGHADADLPPAWPDVDAAFAWCVERAERLPFVMVAPDVLLLKLAGVMTRLASGTGEFSSHSVSAIEAAGMLEQFAHQLHDFPAPPLNYRPQDQEPALTSQAPVRLIIGFSGAGKTSWAAQSAMHEEHPSAYLDVADLPSASVSAALARELAARWLRDQPAALRAVETASLSGIEALRSAGSVLGSRNRTYTVVVDNAHRLEVDDARSIAESLRGLRLVFLAQPTGQQAQLCAAIGVEPEMLRGWSADTIAAEAEAAGCGTAMRAIVEVKRLTAGLPLYVRSALQVAAADYGGSLEAFCDDVNSHSQVSVTAQRTILSRVFGGLDTTLKRILACASIADIPLAAEEVLAMTQAAFGLDRPTVIRSLRSLRSSGLLQAYGSRQSKVHDAMRPIALEHLSDEPTAERQAKEALLGFLERSLEQDQGKEKFPLFVRMLVELRRIEVLADLGTEESFHEVGSFPAVWPLLEEAAQDNTMAARIRFECLDALLYFRQRNGPADAVAPLLARMEALLGEITDARARLVFMQKSVYYWTEQGSETAAQDVLRRLQSSLPDNVEYRRVTEYTAAFSLWKFSRFADAHRMVNASIAEYVASLDVDVQTLLSNNAERYLARIRADDGYATNCKHLADCYDLLARILEGLGRSAGLSRPLAIRLFELTGSWRSVARVGIDLAWQYLDEHEYRRARSFLENGLLTVINAYEIANQMVLTRCLYVKALGRTGDLDAARRELQLIDPYLDSLPPDQRADAQELTAFLR